MHTAGVNECLRSKYRVGAEPELAQVLPARRKRSLIFAVDRLSVCQRIGGRGTALIFFPSVSDLTVPSSPSPEGMTCQLLSVQSGRSSLPWWTARASLTSYARRALRLLRIASALWCQSGVMVLEGKGWAHQQAVEKTRGPKPPSPAARVYSTMR